MDSLPGAIRHYIERALPGPVAAMQAVTVKQTGEMVLKPGARPRPFVATEEFSTQRVAFAWRARFPVLGPVALAVTDSYDGVDGLLEVRVLGLPVQRKRGPGLAQGEAFRYLAELVLAPHAILLNRQLEWCELDERTVEVSTRVADQRICVRLLFDEAGDIVQTVAQRPRLEAGNAVTEWIGKWANYRDLGGVRVPTRGSVRWELPDGPFTYWRGAIGSLELHDSV